MSQAEKYSWLSLITTGFIFWFFQMRMLDGWQIVNASSGQMLRTYISVVILFIIFESIIAGFTAARGDDKQIEKDERDLKIETRAEQYSLWFLTACINIAIIHLLANSFYEGHILPKIDLTHGPTLFFLLFSILILAALVARISTLVLYAVQRTRG